MASRLEVAALSYNPDDSEGERHLNEELKPLVGGLLRTHKLEYVLMEQKKRMEAEILNVGRTVVTTYLSESWRSGSSGGGGGGGGERNETRERRVEEREEERAAVAVKW
jgi:hypothetical protein